MGENAVERDALNPGGADLASYSAIYAVEQSFENVEDSIVLGILSGVLKAGAHGGKL